jgi:hypothetical protein
MINIISTFYISNNELRDKELVTAFIKNINYFLIEKIHLFVDDIKAFDLINNITNYSDKIKIIKIGIKPTYSDYFKYICDYLPDKICMITNSDIYIDSCDVKLLDLLTNNKFVYALTRHEHNLSCPLINNYLGSHDCYIFNSKFINTDIINENTNFYQNFIGIESRIIKSFCDIGFKPYNPCKQIIIIHLHLSQIRNHGKWIGLHNYGDDEYMKKSCWYVPPDSL